MGFFYLFLISIILKDYNDRGDKETSPDYDSYFFYFERTQSIDETSSELL